MDRAMTPDALKLAREARRLRAEALRGAILRAVAWLRTALRAGRPGIGQKAV